MKRSAFWVFFYLFQGGAIALLSWHLLAQVNFAFPIGYQLLGIDENIEKFAPLNLYKADFELTAVEDHWRLFGEICTAIQSGGKGLAEISYTLRSGASEALMRNPEIIHLQDVANIVDAFYAVGVFGFFLWLGLIFIVRQKRMVMPSGKKVLMGLFLGGMLLAACFLVVGPEKAFNWLHTVIFPQGHQWYFFYQESLMTTLMKAPDIFAFIGILLALVFFALWGAVSQGLQWVLRSSRAAA